MVKAIRRMAKAAEALSLLLLLLSGEGHLPHSKPSAARRIVAARS